MMAWVVVKDDRNINKALDILHENNVDAVFGFVDTILILEENRAFAETLMKRANIACKVI